MQVNAGQQNAGEIVPVETSDHGCTGLGLQPIDVASESVQRSQSQICSITKCPSMLRIVKSTAFSKALKAGRTVSSQGFVMFLFS